MVKKDFFELRGHPAGFYAWIFSALGILFTLALWTWLSWGDDPLVPPNALPKPWRVITAFGDLMQDNDLFRNTTLSLSLNLAGYLEAILLALPVGFFIGLFPVFRGMFQRQVDSIRYVPLTAILALFITWFGIGTPMKIHFLAFGIVIYLLPIIVQRIDEVNDIYVKTVTTLGATDWQTIRTVFFPAVLSKLSDDIRVLTAISWTYIIVAEMIGNEGGLGALIYRAGQRVGRTDKVFAILIVIILIGILQDKIFLKLDRVLFPHKYQIADSTKKGRLKNEGLANVLLSFIFDLLIWLLIAAYLVLFLNEMTGFLTTQKIFVYFFERSAWAVHLVFWAIIAFKGFSLYNKMVVNKPVSLATAEKN